jgi:hypothetical protein
VSFGWIGIVAGQCVDGGRAAGDLRRGAAHEGLADGAANQQDGPQRDARGIAQMPRVGLFKPMHVKTLAAQEQRMLLTSRKLLQRKLLDVESDLRGTLRNFGLKVGVVSRCQYEVRSRELVESFPRLAAIVGPLLAVRRVMQARPAPPRLADNGMLWEMSHTPVTAENTSRAISRDRPYARIDQAGLLWLLDGNRLVELFRERRSSRTVHRDLRLSLASPPGAAGDPSRSRRRRSARHLYVIGTANQCVIEYGF